MLLRFSVATLSQFVARFARCRIEDPSFNRLTLNGIPELPATLFFGITRKIKIGKIGNLVFLSIQPIPDLSCKIQNFWTNFFFNFEKWWAKTIPSSGPIVMPIVTNIFLALKKFRNMKLSENFCLSVIFFQKIDWFIYCLKSCKTCAKKIWQAFYVFLTRLTDVRQLFLSTIIYFVLMATSDTSLVLPIPH